MSDETNLVCRNCGHEIWAGETRSPIDISVVWFCPSCGYEMRRKDVLGEIESQSPPAHFSDLPADALRISAKLPPAERTQE